MVRSGLVNLARGLRRSETAAEQMLWSKLRSRQVDGWKFKRQVPFGRYVLDFFCYEARLAIEIDGATHSQKSEIERDQEKTDFLESHGVRVLRVTNSDVQYNVDGVVEMIYRALGQQSAPPTRRILPKASLRLEAPASPQGERRDWSALIDA